MYVLVWQQAVVYHYHQRVQNTSTSSDESTEEPQLLSICEGKSVWKITIIIL